MSFSSTQAQTRSGPRLRAAAVFQLFVHFVVCFINVGRHVIAEFCPYQGGIRVLVRVPFVQFLVAGVLKFLACAARLNSQKLIWVRGQLSKGRSEEHTS